MTRARIQSVLIILVAVLALPAVARASSIILDTPVSMDSMDHGYYYIWGTQNWSLPSGEHVVSATLQIDGVYDWTYENNDKLAAYILKSPGVGPGGAGYKS
jgi:hypothetical protein